MTRDEKRYLGRVAALGCLVCRKLGHDDSPAEIHHRRTGMGRMRASNYETMPLCFLHHRGGGPGVAFHSGQETWEENFGAELEYLAWTRELLDFACAG